MKHNFYCLFEVSTHWDYNITMSYMRQNPQNIKSKVMKNYDHYISRSRHHFSRGEIWFTVTMTTVYSTKTHRLRQAVSDHQSWGEANSDQSVKISYLESRLWSRRHRRERSPIPVGTFFGIYKRLGSQACDPSITAEPLRKRLRQSMA